VIVQGAEDLRTPPEGSAKVAARIPGAQRFVIPGIGHSTVSDPRDCAADQIMRFVRGAKLATRCKRVPTGAPAGPAAPASFESLAGVPGYSRKIGRTLNALLATTQDLLMIFATANTSGGGGLRGGSWEIDGRRIVLRDYQAVTGVSVTGSLREASLSLRISGTKAAKGNLKLSRNRVSGRLDGRRVSARLTRSRALAAAARALSH
jgi:hypothetical protein